MVKKIMITGGCGFIGTQVIKKLLTSEEALEIYVIDNLSTGYYSSSLFRNVHFFWGDIRDERSKKYINDVAPDYMIHLAAQISVEGSVNNPLNDAAVNIMGSLNIIDACRRIPNFQNFVFASSAAVYGNNINIPLKEQELNFPTSPYGQSKSVIEDYLALYHKLYNFPYTTLRFANVYGHKRKGEDVISIFYKNLVAGKTPHVFGDGYQTRDYIYIDDIANALVTALDIKRNTCFNVSTNEKTTIIQVLNYLNLILGTNVQPELLPPRLGDLRDSMLSNEKILLETNWRPEFDLYEGLAIMHQKELKKDGIV
ncbi:hypothetical protein ICM_05660 [Bacillus cereus BAG1X2-3]|uniref:NAD-dependent epimerase/dehydratase domain-containing protein n=1 Tax=Bacillus cereus TaxID=1396 RepID=A0A9X7E0Z6_BACCE|nr:NAD-dependent epimerase/dehydratase family protein [Bacillus cereus]EOO23290.1 hypothetical protein ICC_06176 [Bacillus cereus BAG1X1-1]EOO42861.1 hypothetical protein ICI_06237 [Bacillus cereus BAG1X2-1]EOO56414.1 hypothetical protein ICM_05660 [Bacillus cereus BAG1X2-3]EOP00115.1 hypothetical protein ICO_06542 [Bacillus cereus BAG2O-1]PHA19190.1 hypothetical protein COE70_19520 [Bacillus cereus]